MRLAVLLVPLWSFGCDGASDAPNSWRDTLEPGDDVEARPQQPRDTAVFVECDVIEHRGEILECEATALWCDGSEEGLERQQACCDCDDGNGFCLPTPDEETCASL